MRGRPSRLPPTLLLYGQDDVMLAARPLSRTRGWNEDPRRRRFVHAFALLRGGVRRVGARARDRVPGRRRLETVRAVDGVRAEAARVPGLAGRARGAHGS